MAIHGHSRIVQTLDKYLPPSTLFLGPYSVGRWSVAEHLRWRYSIDAADVTRVRDLDVEAVENIQRFSLTAPAKSEFKLIIIDLYRATRASQVALTTILEDPHYARVIVIATPGEALPGVTSRTANFFFSHLTSSEVASVLIEKMDFGPERAQELAGRAGGQIAQALKLADADEQLTLVRTALRAIRGKDADELNSIANAWTDETTGWLIQWCNENISGQWRVFDHEDYVKGLDLPLKLAIVLRERVRPRLVVRSQLMSVLRGD